MTLFVDSLFLDPTTDTSSSAASSGSTPTTTVADTDSQHSDASKLDVITVAAPEDAIYVASAEFQESAPSQSPPYRRPRRARASEPVYNLSKLSGTADHGKRRAKGDCVAEKRRRTISGDTLIGSIEVAAVPTTSKPRDKTLTADVRMGSAHLLRSSASIDSPRIRRQQIYMSPRSQRMSSRLSGMPSITAPVTNITKNSRRTVNQVVTHLSRELRRLQDTNEFSGVDDRPVVHTVWSNGKYVDPNAPRATPTNKSMTKEPEEENKRVKGGPKEKTDANEKKGQKEKRVKGGPKEKTDANEKKGQKEKRAKEVGVDEAEEAEPGAEEPEPVVNTKQRKATKKYLDRGLYAGQDMPIDVFKGLTPAERKQLATQPELKELSKTGLVNKVMPMPIYTGLRTLFAGRDFKLPYNVCNPMPPGQPKPDEWKKMTKNRFIGDSRDYWRKVPHLHDLSKCVCKPEDGCGDNCQNRIMLYECDKGNCNVGEALCTNRSFADLASRRAKGGKYRIGVEVIKTSDRGYGVRSNRCFQPNQIIMEYTGEIITEVECERRMKQEYKNNECYYLMSFDQHMIIDATTGSIARFVNHSCKPNCRMIKWIVSGQPRMALFAGDRPIMTGDELTYDYNFDPFSKNVQTCLCGEANCRGVLGPKPRDVKPAKVDLNKTIKATVKAGKRKLKELMRPDQQSFDYDYDEDDQNNSSPATKKQKKQRKSEPASGLKSSLSRASLKAAKGAALAIKNSVSSMRLKAKTKARTKTGAAKSSVAHRRASTGAVKSTTTLTTTTITTLTNATVNGKLAKKNGKASSSRPAQKFIPSGKTIVAKGNGKSKPVPVPGTGTGASAKATGAASRRIMAASAKSSPRASTPRRIIKPTPKANANAAK
ncbi:hypothetical protein E4U59_003360 [Claviceps monticola]|nr:hypothetical protein E4U59_003360 [Claviceps monticola]